MSPMCPYMALDTTKIHTPIKHFERPVSESSAKMTLPLTYNVVRLFKLIHLSAIERARMIYA